MLYWKHIWQYNLGRIYFYLTKFYSKVFVVDFLEIFTGQSLARSTFPSCFIYLVQLRTAPIGFELWLLYATRGRMVNVKLRTNTLQSEYSN